MIQVRHVPDEVHRTLKARAAHAGMTLSDYLREEITKIAKRPTLEEALERIEARARPKGAVDAAAAIREEREGR